MKSILTVLATGLAAAAGLPGQAQLILGEETVQISEHVHAILGFPNIGIVVGANAVLVVDTGLGPRNGATIAKAAARLAERKINVWDGHNYAWEVTGALGIRDSGSAVRAGLVHYNDASDVDRLLTAVADLGRPR